MGCSRRIHLPRAEPRAPRRRQPSKRHWHEMAHLSFAQFAQHSDSLPSRFCCFRPSHFLACVAPSLEAVAHRRPAPLVRSAAAAVRCKAWTSACIRKRNECIRRRSRQPRSSSSPSGRRRRVGPRSRGSERPVMATQRSARHHYLDPACHHRACGACARLPRRLTFARAPAVTVASADAVAAALACKQLHRLTRTARCHRESVAPMGSPPRGGSGAATTSTFRRQKTRRSDGAFVQRVL